MVWGVIPHSSFFAVGLQLIIMVSLYRILDKWKTSMYFCIVWLKIYLCHFQYLCILFKLIVGWNECAKFWFISGFMLNGLFKNHKVYVYQERYVIFMTALSLQEQLVSIMCEESDKKELSKF
jgi:hypothetical protein